MKNLFFILLLLTVAIKTKAQTRKIVLSIYPYDCVIHLDDSVYYHNPLTLIIPEGIHTLKAWAPKHELFETRIKVNADSTKTFFKNLSYSGGYKIYMHQLENYRFKKFKHKILPPVSLLIESGLASVFFIGLNKNMKKVKTKALSEQTLYNASNVANSLYSSSIYNSSIYNSRYLADLNMHKELFDSYKKEYNRLYYERLALQGICIVGGIGTTWWIIHQWKKSKKIIKPVFEEEPLLTFNPYIDYSVYSSKGIKMNLRF